MSADIVPGRESMGPATTASPTRREPDLLGQTVVVIGGTAGIGLGTARRARAEGANLILTGRNPERLQHAARELAPVRVNLIAAGFVDTPLSASLLGDQLEHRRNQLRATLPIRRRGTGRRRRTRRTHHDQHGLTGATYDIDGGQQFVAG